MMLVEETTIPVAALPVAEFKAHLRLGTGFADDAVQDPVLESFLRAAIAAIEARTGKILFERRFSWSLTHWRNTDGQFLPVAPAVRLDALKLIAQNGDETVFPISEFSLVSDQHRPKVEAVGKCLPTIPAQGSVEVEFTAGFAHHFGGLPADLSQAVLLLAAHYYENRSAIGIPDTAIPFGVLVLIERYKTLRILGGGAA